jgi:two-component sensor histidine kinase
MPSVMTDRLNRSDGSGVLASLRSLTDSFTNAHAKHQSKTPDSLTLAVIVASQAPQLLLDADLTVIAASRSFCRAFQIDPVDAVGRQFVELGAGEWNVPQLASLLQAAASSPAEVKDYEFDFKRDGRENRHLVASAHKLDYADAGNIRLLLTLFDATDVRIAEKLKHTLLREKAVLFQELQHRVGNSLQIVASVLMQSARKTQSEETRDHLHEAHQRVMSIVAMQKQLAASSINDVELRPYFTTLCRSIGAAMIQDHNRLSLEVRSDEIKVSSDMSVSLGLIVTELVINALKHAFPDNRNGKIVVDYHTNGVAWTLSVVDNGIGMPKGAETPKAGLGTSIVRALTQQLQAHIKVADSKPGTSVCVFNSQIAAADGNAKAIPIAKAV